MPYYSRESDQPKPRRETDDGKRYSVVYAIEQFMMNFNKRQDYMRVMYPTWESHLEMVKDQVIMEASKRLCRSSEQYAKLSHFLDHVEDIIREQGGTGLTIKNYQYCEDCQVNDGIRYTTFAYVLLETQETITRNRVTRCTCKGSCDHYPNMMAWNVLLDKLTNDARIQLLGHWVTDYRYPRLPRSITDPDGYDALQKHLQEERDSGRVNHYLQYIHKLEEWLASKESEQEEELPPW